MLKAKNINRKHTVTMYKTLIKSISVFHHAFFNSIIDKTPTPALFIQHYISLAC